MLKNPPKEYRSVPFWSWNDKLDQNELRWQIQKMKEKGIGGFFMHARGGLETPYMENEWMECIDACVEEAEAADMEAWMYDEEGWPSGFAGGKVTELGDAFYVRWLEMEQCESHSVVDTEGILGLYNSEFQYLGNRLEDIKSVQSTSVIVIRHKSNPYYVDTLNEAVIQKFIDVTHETYKERFGDVLGKRIPGFFTDEPQYAKCKYLFDIQLFTAIGILDTTAFLDHGDHIHAF